MTTKETITKFSRGKNVDESEVIMIDEKLVLISDVCYDFRVFTLEQIVEELDDLRLSPDKHNLNNFNSKILETLSKYFQDLIDNLK